MVAELQSEALQRLVRVETKVDNIDEKLDQAIKGRDLAIEALQSTKTAKYRLDKIEDNQRWLWRTFIGAIIVAAVALVFKGGI